VPSRDRNTTVRNHGRRVAVALSAGLLAAACTSTAATTTTNAATTQRPIATTVAPQVSPPITAAPIVDVVDPWEVDVVHVNDYVGANMRLGVEEIVSATSLIAARIDWIGEPGSGRWCCENPPLQITGVEILGGALSETFDGTVLGIDYQSLDTNLEIGDRVTILVSADNIALLLFDSDGGLAHPTPQHQSDAISAMRVREAASSGGWDPLEYSPLRAITDIWGRYHTDWWGSVAQRVDLAVSGVPGYRVVCSAADLEGSAAVPSYPPSVENLPSTVARTRHEIIVAATACDYDKILTLTAFVDGDDTDLFWWSGGSTPEIFIEADRRFGALRQLVMALTNTAYAEEEVNAEDGSGEYVDQTFYVWPSAAVLVGEANARQSTVETLGEEEAERVAVLNQMTIEELDESMGVFPGYALFRTAIDAAGRWRFALSGD
jgi:hypothetical protein